MKKIAFNLGPVILKALEDFMKKKTVVRINGDIVGTDRHYKHDKHLSSLNWIALLDSEPQLAIKLQLENLIATYGLENVELISTFVISDAKKDAA